MYKKSTCIKSGVDIHWRIVNCRRLRTLLQAVVLTPTPRAPQTKAIAVLTRPQQEAAERERGRGGAPGDNEDNHHFVVSWKVAERGRIQAGSVVGRLAGVQHSIISFGLADRQCVITQLFFASAATREVQSDCRREQQLGHSTCDEPACESPVRSNRKQAVPRPGTF